MCHIKLYAQETRLKNFLSWFPVELLASSPPRLLRTGRDMQGTTPNKSAAKLQCSSGRICFLAVEITSLMRVLMKKGSYQVCEYTVTSKQDAFQTQIHQKIYSYFEKTRHGFQS